MLKLAGRCDATKRVTSSAVKSAKGLQQ
jgi:hypothetical protein